MLREAAAITAMNLRNVWTRRRASSVIVVGIAGVVGVLLGLLSMAAGFATALRGTSQPDRGLILRSGSANELESWFGSDQLGLIADLPGIVQASGEVFVVLDLADKRSGSPTSVVGRGVTHAAFDLRPELEIVEGRKFEPGRNEMVVGAAASRQYRDLGVGDHVELRDNTFAVVGRFESGGSFRRGPAVNSARVRLVDRDTAPVTRAAIAADPRLQLQLVTEPEFYAAQSRERTALIEGFGYFVAGIMAVGALIAAVNTMYSAVNARAREIATLRALGFGGVPIVTSVMAEAMVLAILGGLLGGALVYALFDGYTASTLNGASSTQVAFAFRVTPEALVAGIVVALGLGFVGALLPALQAARTPVASALRGS
jgi:putative ABC transport system permease protein